LLRALIAQRHWQRFQTFEAQFRHAARELAEHEHDPDLAKLTVSSRQWERWYAGKVKTEPHPDACRVLEHMFGYPIQQLLAIRETGSNQPYGHSEHDQYGSLRPISDVMLSTPGMAETIPHLEEFRLLNILGPADESDEDVMKRRAFLMGLAALTGLGATAPGMSLESMRHGLNRALAERDSVADVDEWHEIALEYGHMYPITAPSELLKSLVTDFYGLQAAIERYPNDGTQRKLRQVGAMLSAFTAQTVANLGYLREARRWWRTARRAADESDDRYTMLWIRGREIVRAGYEHRPLTAILQLIDEAEARVDTSPPVAALPEFLSGKAQTLALMGRPASTDTEATLIRLRKVFEALPLPLKAASDSIFTWGEERLWFTESLVYTYLGDFRRADTAQGRALALYPVNDLRSPAQIELQRALCLVSAGDVLPGVCHAQSIVSNLPAMHRVRPVADLGHKVLRAVPIAEQQRASIQEYHECLNASFATPTPQLTA
jgi:tetratricopeptide (TPR) repeat protein